MASRLQLGTSRLEDLDVRVLDTFLDETWIHLGDAESQHESRNLTYYSKQFREHPVRFVRLALREAFGRSDRPQRTSIPPEELYRRTTFQGFYFKKGDRLPFEESTFDFVFSEHFFHHLFFDEALALFRECHRIMKPRGVIRTVVPDADLRSYLPPEPVGFPDVKMSFTAALKHKTRYSVYMLAETLRIAGFEPVPLHYCDRAGEYHRKNPASMRETYDGCPEATMVFDLGYIIRPDSLIVDGIKDR